MVPASNHDLPAPSPRDSDPSGQNAKASAATLALGSGKSAPDAKELGPDLHIPGYILTQRLGSGSYGQVWQAVRVGAGQDVAVKIFTAPGKLDWRYLQREVDRLLRVSEHPHIVTLLDANLYHDPPFYAMVLLRKGSLAELSQPNQPFRQVERAVVWFEQIVRALAFAHGKGLLHCDLKPANVLLDEEDNIRLVDFGQSQLRGEAAHALGTLTYMAPEQAVVASEEESPPDPSVSWDIYGLGATMYALLSGQSPHNQPGFHATLTSLEDVSERLTRYREHVLQTPITSLRILHPGVDRELAAIVEHCLEPDPVRRYLSMTELAEDLRRRREHLPLLCLPSRWTYRLRKFVRRQMGMVFISMISIIALTVVIITNTIERRVMQEERNSKQFEIETRLQSIETQMRTPNSDREQLTRQLQGLLKELEGLRKESQ